MDGQEYLNQISKETRTEAKSSKLNRILSSKFFLVGAIGIIALIVIIIIGAILGSGRDREKNLSYTLALHINNTVELIDEYQPDLKSSNLRSSSASFQSVLSNTDRDLDGYLTEKYDFKEKNVDKKIVEEVTLNKDGLDNELFEAKINGILDRIYAHKMAYEISLFIAEEDSIINSTKNTRLKEILTTSRDSLSNLYDKFNDFSETK